MYGLRTSNLAPALGYTRTHTRDSGSLGKLNFILLIGWLVEILELHPSAPLAD
jgi:hypothetical protein